MSGLSAANHEYCYVTIVLIKTIHHLVDTASHLISCHRTNTGLCVVEKQQLLATVVDIDMSMGAPNIVSENSEYSERVWWR